jgi:hypothetical protein
LLTSLGKTWLTNAWVYSYYITNSYDGGGNLLIELTDQWQDSVWINSSRNTYTYDGNGNMVTELGEVWSSTIWINYFKENCTYDANGNKLTDFTQRWQSNIWMDDLKLNYTYDGNGNILSRIIAQWQNGSLVYKYNDIYTYDAQGNSITGDYYAWYHNNWHVYLGGLFVYSQKIVITNYLNDMHHYDAHFISFETGIENNMTNNNLARVYPNPATTTLTIDGFSNASTAEVYDLSGKLLLSKQLNANQFDISSLAKGLYFIKLSTDKGSMVKKFVKE